MLDNEHYVKLSRCPSLPSARAAPRSAPGLASTACRALSPGDRDSAAFHARHPRRASGVRHASAVCSAQPRGPAGGSHGMRWRTASRPVDVPPGRAMPASPACRRDRARACRACRGAPPDPDRLPAGPVPGRPSLAPAEAARRGRVLPAPRRDARIRRSPDVSPTLRPEFEHLCEPDGLPIRAVRRAPRHRSMERSSAAVAPPYPSVILKHVPGRERTRADLAVRRRAGAGPARRSPVGAA